MLCIMMIMAMVTRAADITALWDFQNNFGDGDVNIEGTTGSVASTVDGITLYVDATSGKLRSRGSDAQFNNGTILRVPVTTAKDTVTVTSYPGYHYFNVGGAAATDDVTIHRATTAEAAQGYVEIVATNTAYLYNIKVVHVSMIQEKQLYSSTFTEWGKYEQKENVDEVNIDWNTKYSHETLSFAIYHTKIGASNFNTDKFPNWTGGMLMAAKSDDPYIITSPLASITRVHYFHGATGSKRGWAIWAKGDGDNDWVLLSDAVATTQQGTDVDVDVNRTNVQLKFTNINPSQNAYLLQLDIYGNVDMSKTPALGTLTLNGITYQAADIFEEQADGTMAATIEISKLLSMVGENNPITTVADNGEVGEITYTQDGDATIVAIPVTANDQTVNYVARCIFKPDFT